MEKEQKHIVSFSGGKDSTAMLLLMIEHNMPIDEVIFCDTGVEFEDMYTHIDSVEKAINFPITRLKAKNTYEYYMFDYVKQKGKRIGESGYSWATMKNRWCTAMFKRELLKSYVNKKYPKSKYDIIEYHGIALDEMHRTKRNDDRVIKYPLIDFKMTEEECLGYCYSKGFYWNNLYENLNRVSCWCCPLKGMEDLKKIYQEYPIYWEKLKDFDNRARTQFKDDYSVEDLEKKFKGRDRMKIQELRNLQNYPLFMKIAKTQHRIREWYEHYNGEVYVSLSGGKDSIVLLHIARELYPDIEAVFCDTGLEYPEIRDLVKKIDNVTWIKPIVPFKKVVETSGYPIISKDVANCIRLARENIKEGKDTLRVRQLTIDNPDSKFCKKRWEFLLDAPFKISERCCNELKKRPFKEYEKKTGKKAMIGTMACESSVREGIYLKYGCNAFDIGRSTPLGFWTDQDILEYIVKNKIEIASVYGDVVKGENGKYHTTGLSRTGCMFCGFGVHLEKHPNRFEQMKITHPKQYDYCINKLGMGEVLDYINVKY